MRDDGPEKRTYGKPALRPVSTEQIFITYVRLPFDVRLEKRPLSGHGPL